MTHHLVFGNVRCEMLEELRGGPSGHAQIQSMKGLHVCSPQILDGSLSETVDAAGAQNRPGLLDSDGRVSFEIGVQDQG